MNKKRIGFLTPSGTIAATLTILFVVGIGFATGGALFSPGPLNAKSGSTLGGVTSHAELANRCGSCHAPFWGKASMADLCETCHTDIPAQLGDLSRPHGQLLQNSPTLTCRDCHPEHRGQNAALIDMSKANIDHNAFGYSLAAHAAKSDGSPFGCADCHTKGYVGFDQSICATCHGQVKPDFMQAHLQAYGDKCLGCHDGVDLYGHAFTHSLLAFQLNGKHSQVACAGCHTGARTIADMKATSQECNSCHAKDDVHKGDLGTGCATCHGLEGWSPSTFNHETAAFKLTGKHAQVGCFDCHQNNVIKGTPSDCNSCHTKDDVHKGDLGKLCDGCHTTAGWLPANFDHNLAIFKLVGKHALVPCLDCHVNNVYKGTPTDCYACHSKDDVHQGQLGAACTACHTAAGWTPSSFSHSSASFTLTGAHAGVACSGCHNDLLFKKTPSDCNSCHSKDDAHKGQLGPNCFSCHSTAGWSPSTFNHNSASFKLTGKHAGVPCASCHVNNAFNGTPSDCASCHSKNDAHSGQLGSNCATCHSTSAWSPATFNHNSVSFKLTGKHAGISCSSCHQNSTFKGTPSDCYSCHAKDDTHKGQFGTSCSACHSTTAWQPSTFNHNTSSFPLVGKHAGVSCNSCHANNVFKGTPTNCYACHAKDDTHGGQFGADCGTCHSPNGWSPASFDHNIVFALTGAHSSLSCNSCHTNGGFTGLSTSCSSCHSDPPFHAGLFAGTSCSSCHSTSSWTPASYTGSHPGGCDGNCIKHKNATCRDCHTTNLNSATCTKCHDSNKPGD